MTDYLDIDNIKQCENNCIFCFIDQMPPGMRKTLYVKDDDFRHSYLYGNYITLTNCTEKELEYIADNNLSPLYISVHALNPDIRKKIMNNENAGKIQKNLSFLTSEEISLNIQIVLIPGLNDGEILKETLRGLYKFTPYIDSVGIVPVGLTRFRKNLEKISSVDSKKALEVLNLVTKFQKKAFKEYGVKWVYPADEFFLLAEKKIPGDSFYNKYEQIENGIGITRKFLNSFHRASKRKVLDFNRKGYLITSVSGKKIFDTLIKKYNLNIELIVVKNKFFGESITVTGLLTARDILFNISKKALKDYPVLVPDIIFNFEEYTLDNVSREEILKTDNRINIIKTKGCSLTDFFRS
ncbi:MAG: DUF512 domain-containing protein [Candidatus Muiribacteriota bacterium]